MTDGPPIVLVVDDDPSVLQALRRLIRVAGFQVQTFAGSRELLAADIPKANACLILDVNLPVMNGVELREALAAWGCTLPAIMMTGRGDARTRCILEKADAIAVLFKPFEDKALIEAISRAIAESRRS
jgi:FixJ family two-component response regulator